MLNKPGLLFKNPVLSKAISGFHRLSLAVITVKTYVSNLLTSTLNVYVKSDFVTHFFHLVYKLKDLGETVC